MRRLFFLLGILYMMRAITMYVTAMPVASLTYVCSPKSNHTDIGTVMMRAIRIFAGMGLSINGQHVFCGDYIYSGHTVILTTASLVIQEYTPRKWRPLHWLSWLITLLGVIFVMVAHGHYTVDVLIAYYVTTRVVWMYHTMANNPVLKVLCLFYFRLDRLFCSQFIYPFFFLCSKVDRTTTWPDYGGTGSFYILREISVASFHVATSGRCHGHVTFSQNTLIVIASEVLLYVCVCVRVVK